jgi:uncharacterized protein (TIGR00369 family)
MLRMPAYRRPSFETYDPKIADAMIRANEAGQGLEKYLGVRFEEYGPGRLVAAMDVRSELVTPMGAVHGGVIAGFVDHVMGCVLYPLMKRGQWAATTEFKLNYLAAVKGGRLVAEAAVLSFGRRSAVVRVEVVAGDRLASVAQGTLLVSDPPKSA